MLFFGMTSPILWATQDSEDIIGSSENYIGIWSYTWYSLSGAIATGGVKSEIHGNLEIGRSCQSVSL